MGFTAISYGKRVRVIPSAGSAYTYVRKSVHPSPGFPVGWTSLIDYLLLPRVNALILRSDREALFPDIPGWVWVVVFNAGVTGVIYLTMRGTSNRVRARRSDGAGGRARRLPRPRPPA